MNERCKDESIVGGRGEENEEPREATGEQDRRDWKDLPHLKETVNSLTGDLASQNKLTT